MSSFNSSASVSPAETLWALDLYVDSLTGFLEELAHDTTPVECRANYEQARFVLDCAGSTFLDKERRTISVEVGDMVPLVAGHYFRNYADFHGAIKHRLYCDEEGSFVRIVTVEGGQEIDHSIENDGFYCFG